jgi:hypothetical protein
VVTVPDRAGPAHPLESSPARRNGSVRRTTSIDSSRPDAMTGAIEVDARARDYATSKRFTREGQNEQRLRATLGADRSLQTVEADPPDSRLTKLIGAVVGPGFRATMTGVLPDHANRRTLLHTLLDDLPGAILVSGYATQRVQPPLIPAGRKSEGAFARHVQAAEEMCSGWATDATIMVTFRSTGSVPIPMGPLAPRLERADDPASWHVMATLARQATRRRRRLDLLPPSGDQANWTFDSHFRDSYRDAEGVETAVHEYSVDGWLDVDRSCIGGARAVARVLPWVECPAAVNSASRMAGRSLSDLRSEVRNEFTGTTTCTHLNDSFRVLADLTPLLRLAIADDENCGALFEMRSD